MLTETRGRNVLGRRRVVQHQRTAMNEDVAIFRMRDLAQHAAGVEVLVLGYLTQVANGGATVNGTGLAEGDGAAVEGESLLAITAPSGGEVLLFDLP